MCLIPFGYRLAKSAASQEFGRKRCAKESQHAESRARGGCWSGVELFELTLDLSKGKSPSSDNQKIPVDVPQWRLIVGLGGTVQPTRYDRASLLLSALRNCRRRRVFDSGEFRIHATRGHA